MNSVIRYGFRLGLVAAFMPIVLVGGCDLLFPGSGSPIRSTDPVIIAITPDQGVVDGGTEVVISGQNFTSGMDVRFGDVPCSNVQMADSETLTLLTPAHLPGQVDVVVRTSGGRQASKSDGFTYSEAVRPGQGPTTGGTHVTILSNRLFSEGMIVLFGPNAADQVEVLNESVVTAVTPPHAAGVVDVTLQGVGSHQIVLPLAYEYVAAIPDEGGPRLVSAVATSNRSVLVMFSEAVAAGADTVANYSIAQANVHAESAVLLVYSATVGPDGLTVLLETAPQNEVTYELHVTNIRDLAGNPLAAPELLVDPTRTQFAGTPATGAEGMLDSDSDGLPDSAEQYGWTVTVELADGQVTHRTVTSDPGLMDTDGDGVGDAVERAMGSNPRSADTDGDLLTDLEEWNEWFSNPNDQDTDDDSLFDSLEVDFQTSPVIADTDGDQLGDAEEILQRNRNPLLADLPLPQITVGEIRLDVKVTSSYTDEEGVTHAVSDVTSTTFAQSRTDVIGRSDTNSTESENTFSQTIGVEAGYSTKDGFAGKITSETGFGQRRTRGFSSTTNTEQARNSQEEHQRSVSDALILSEGRTTTRTIDEAIIQANVNISNQSDIAFTITNLEISVQQQDRQNDRRFRPIATLRPSGVDSPLAQPSYNLGPFDPERGPIIFENVEVFPNLIDDLMREPTGLVFKVVNFDILDEFGRNFVFSSQEVNDRTVGITIDFGSGVVESYRVATNSRFDASGRAVGITMERALEIIGITRTPGEDAPFIPPSDPFEPLPSDIRQSYGTSTDNEGYETLTRIRGVQNDLEAVPVAEKRFWAIMTSDTSLSRSVDFSTMVVHAGDDFLLLFTRDIDRDHLFEREEYLYGSDDRMDDTDGDGLTDYFEVRTGWTVNRRPGQPYLAFPSPARPDSDSDALDDNQEFMAGTDPSRADTDEDGLVDAAELLGAIEIMLFDGDADDFNNKIITIAPYTSWAIIDGGNGQSDTAVAGDDEQVVAVGDVVLPGDIVIRPGPNGVLDTTPAGDDINSLADAIVNRTNTVCETAATGDDIQVVPLGNAATTEQVLIRAGINGVIDSTPGGDDAIRVRHAGLFTTDPLSRDTDFDGLGDGREVLVGTHPNISDGGSVTDSDHDGLFDIEEDAGWDVTIYDSAAIATTIHVTSNKYRADTDLDGIPDVFERAIGSNPRLSDTDGDGLFDVEEFDPEDTDQYYSATAMMLAAYRCGQASGCEPVSVLPLGDRLRSHVCMRDTDGDLLDDDVEVNTPWVVQVVGAVPYEVYGKPWSSDGDFDGLSDRDEMLGANGIAGDQDATDPTLADTDSDAINDKIEVDRHSDPLAKDKYLRFTFLQIECIDADDEGAPPADCIEVYGEWYIAKGSQDVVVRKLTDYGFCDADVLSLNKVYDFIIREADTVDVGTRGTYEDDSSTSDDDFSEFHEPFSYSSVPSGIYALRNTGSDGTLETTFQVEIILDVPDQQHFPP